MPTLADAFEEYMAVNPNRSRRTNELYRYQANRYLGDWFTRPLDTVTEGYAADWTLAQLREPAQRIADQIEALMSNEESVDGQGPP